MRIYRSKIPKICMEIVSSLASSNDIEVPIDKVPDIEMDLKAILENYNRVESEVVDKAKEQIEKEGLQYKDFNRVKKLVAREMHHVTGEDGTDWVINQMIECLMISPNVEEVFAEDPAIRRKIHDVFKRNMVDEEQLDQEVRDRIKNLKEGTQEWDIEYQKVMRDVKRKHGLM